MKDNCYRDKKMSKTYKLAFYFIMLFAALLMTTAIVLSYTVLEEVSYILFAVAIGLFVLILWLASRHYDPTEEIRTRKNGLLSRYVRFLYKYHMSIAFVGAQIILFIYILTVPRRTLGETIALIVICEISVALGLILIRKQRRKKGSD